MAVNRITAIIHSNDAGWPWHDRNNAGELIDTSLTLTANVSKYAISEAWLKIAKVRIKQADGITWTSLTFKSNQSLGYF